MIQEEDMGGEFDIEQKETFSKLLANTKNIYITVLFYRKFECNIIHDKNSLFCSQYFVNYFLFYSLLSLVLIYTKRHVV